MNRELKGLDTVTRQFGISSAIGWGAAAGAAAGFLKMGFTEFNAAEKAMAQTNAAIESTGGVAGITAEHVSELAGKMMQLAAVDDEVIQGAENVLLTFTNVRNVGIDKIFDQATLAALNLSARMGTDLQSSILLVGKALQDPIKGVTALRRAGVQLSAEQTTMIRKFIEAGDVMSAQKIILGELETQFKGSAEAAGDTFAGQVALLQLNLENFSGEVVGVTVPALLALTGFFGDTAVAVSKLSDSLSELKDPVEDAFGFFGDALDLLPYQLKVAAVASTAFFNPFVAGNALIYGTTRVIDRFSESTDGATTATEDFAHSVEMATGASGFAATAVGGLDTAFRNLHATGRGGEEMLGAIADVGSAFDGAADAADKARRAFFDALNVPSAERSQRELVLAQGQFNVGRLEQQRGGTGEDSLLSPKREAWYQWLVSTFIPAQEDWLKLDELRIDRDEKAAVLAESLTGDYHDMDQAIRGQLTPGLRALNDATFDTNDAMQGLKQVSPVKLAVTATLPTTGWIAREGGRVRREIRGEIPASFDVAIKIAALSAATAGRKAFRDFRGEVPGRYGIGIDVTGAVREGRTAYNGLRGELGGQYNLPVVIPPTAPVARVAYGGLRGELGYTLPTPVTIPDPAPSARVAYRGIRGELGYSLPTPITIPDPVPAVIIAAAGEQKWLDAHPLTHKVYPDYRRPDEARVIGGGGSGTVGTLGGSAGSTVNFYIQGGVGSRADADRMVNWLYASWVERNRAG